ncbi:hypothetical protein AB2B38_008820 [Balneola sp. MJW-20]|uniref:hypothetical protein n=1 Tax=Gracilimonas aurantiaca TaxID=3234185 RepID=UPI0034660635
MKKLLILFLLLCTSITLKAQENQIISLNRNTYTYIKQLQQRGLLSRLNPTQQPYTRKEVQDALDELSRTGLNDLERYWVKLIEDEVGIDRENKDYDKVYVNGVIGHSLEFNNTINEQGIRPQDDSDVYLLPMAEGQLYVEKDQFIAQMGLRHDLFYHYDQRGQYALSRYYVRSEDYYIGFQNDFAKIYLGRFDERWAPIDELSTVLSNNARSFDRISMSFGNTWIRFSSTLGELDNIGPNDVFNPSKKANIGGKQRYLTTHRIDLKITDGLRLTYFDGFLYSSQNSGVPFKYLSPVNFFFFDRGVRPVDDEYNAFFGGQVWGHYRGVTTNLQVMIDDLQVDRAGSLDEPITFSVSHSTHWAGVINNLDFGYETEAVAYQTYNTDQAEGRYLFLQRGIATQFTDYLMGSLYLKWYPHQLIRGLTLTPRYTLLAQGEQQIDQPFVREYPNGDTIDIILTGTEAVTHRGSLNLFYNPIPEFWIEGELGYNKTFDAGNIPGRSNEMITGRIEAGFRLELDQAGKLLGLIK